jgi:hypothetical protein
MFRPKELDLYQGPSKPLEQMSPEELEEWEEIQGMQRHIFKRTAPQASIRRSPASPQNQSPSQGRTAPASAMSPARTRGPKT